MKEYDDLLKLVVSHAKSYGFIFPSSQIYDGLSSIYDYGPYGVALKNNLKDYWWKAMVNIHKNIVGIDTSILMHPTTWKSSGHVDSFNDLLIENKDSGYRYRVDVLLEDYCEKLQQKKISERIVHSMEANNLSEIKKLIDELGISDAKSGSKNWTDVRKFNLMFQTSIGSESTTLYLRPETAQGVFVNLMTVQKSTRMKIPFGIAQIGKVFRNEIIARQFIFRMREFEQMEMQFFVAPGEEIKWYEYWKEIRLKWHLALGLSSDNYRVSKHTKLAHYANAASDIEFRFPFGFREIEGIHSRTDFDLKNHQYFSGKKIQYFDAEKNKSYIPYVIETSLGLDRLFLVIFSSSLHKEILADGTSRFVLKLPEPISPIKAAILPLLKKDGLPELAEKIFDEFKWKYSLVYEDKESIGKRYRRQDAIGTPFCFTIDYESLRTNTLTVRYRDTMKQERLSIKELDKFLEEKVSMKKLLTSCYPCQP
ncbi:glycine--tRNA ligase [Candidatus Walczuchella endosymbiont of Icerya purchasi]|uniref:glycine--tRNA ligase n=1 Tax=Candidatus Walczuchella endosymbiont of Icerya purchasi TaxID=3066219 RepID=UPI00313BA62A